MSGVKVSYEDIVELIHKGCTGISADVQVLMRRALERETVPSARVMLQTMLDNVAMAGRLDKPVCQSPGFPTVWVRYDDGMPVAGLREHIQKALAECTAKGYIRPSIVHSLTRNNPGDSSGEGVPNMEYRLVPGLPYLEIIASFKGCGAELGNASVIMTTATLGKDLSGLKKLVLETVVKAGGIPCPPSALGIGIGGQMDVASKLSREAVSTRDWRDTNPDPLLAALETELLDSVNKLGVGPAGIGGDTTTLAVKIAHAATHTAICPVTVNFHCWVARRFGVRIYPDGTVQHLFQEGDY
ncbi:MAG: fumarate hydratase [Methylobacteriaceae bacterium]|jgi:fumarate hydratase subunit alpha|nr:fumarate hydratase [Methylobacteriaceae bacterium]